MDKNVIQVILVGGHTGTGKSTIASLIEMKLLEQGFELEYIKEFPDDDKFLKEKIEALKGKNTKIVLKEIQLQKPAIVNDERAIVE